MVELYILFAYMASLAGGVSLTKGDPYGAVLWSASESTDEHLRRFDDGTLSSYVTWLFTLPDFRRTFALSLKTDAGSVLTSRKRCRAVLQLGAWIVDKYLSTQYCLVSDNAALSCLFSDSTAGARDKTYRSTTHSGSATYVSGKASL